MKNVFLIGDYIEDVSCFGTAARICPEAPVPVFIEQHRRTSSGGAGLVSDNLQALGCKVDEHFGSTSRKTRFYVGHHLLLRKDEDAIDVHSLPHDLKERILATDAVVVSDYYKGAITDECARHITALCLWNEKKLFVDTKRKRPEVYAGCFAIFPNEAEMPLIAPKVYRHVIHKAGMDGCYVDGLHVPSENPQEAYDVTGAGDSFLAAFVNSFLEGGNLEDCAKAANAQAAESVKHIGGYVVKPSCAIVSANGS